MEQNQRVLASTPLFVAFIALACCVLSSAGCAGEIADPRTTGGNLGPTGPGPNCRDLPLQGESSRLDRRELLAAIEAALGFRPNVELKIPDANLNSGFTTYPAATRIERGNIDDIADTADEIAVEAMAHFDALVSCDTDSESCANEFIDEVIPRLYRQVVDSSDLEKLKELYQTLRGGTEPLDPELALAGVLSAALQSPAFLYQLELGREVGGARRLSGDEIANRLSFVFWDMPPDDLLREAARDGSLDSAPGRRSAAERLLDDARAREPIVRYFRQWFHIEGKDFSGRVSERVAGSWDEEFRRTIEAAVFDEGTVSDLAGDATSKVNLLLAEHYGFTADMFVEERLPRDNDEWLAVIRPNTYAGGVLTTGAVAAASASDGSTSIIHRGRLVRDGLFCQPLPDPPPDATAQQPVLPENATPREISEARFELETCGTCHSLMDPIGLGMEDLDQRGQFRDQYPSGTAVDPVGTLAGADVEGDFTGTGELARLIAESTDFQRCAVDQWFRFALGRPDEASCHAFNASAALEASDYDLREVLLSVVESDAFVLRSNEGVSE